MRCYATLLQDYFRRKKRSNNTILVAAILVSILTSLSAGNARSDELPYRLFSNLKAYQNYISYWLWSEQLARNPRTASGYTFLFEPQSRDHGLPVFTRIDSGCSLFNVRRSSCFGFRGYQPYIIMNPPYEAVPVQLLSQFERYPYAPGGFIEHIPSNEMQAGEMEEYIPERLMGEIEGEALALRRRLNSIHFLERYRSHHQPGTASEDDLPETPDNPPINELDRDLEFRLALTPISIVQQGNRVWSELLREAQSSRPRHCEAYRNVCIRLYTQHRPHGIRGRLLIWACLVASADGTPEAAVGLPFRCRIVGIEVNGLKSLLAFIAFGIPDGQGAGSSITVRVEGNFPTSVMRNLLVSASEAIGIPPVPRSTTSRSIILSQNSGGQYDSNRRRFIWKQLQILIEINIPFGDNGNNIWDISVFALAHEAIRNINGERIINDNLAEEIVDNFTQALSNILRQSSLCQQFSIVDESSFTCR